MTNTELQGLSLFVATIPGSDELQWLDVTITRPTAAVNVEGGAKKNGGFAALQGEKENTRKHGNRNEVGHRENQ